MSEVVWQEDRTKIHQELLSLIANNPTNKILFFSKSIHDQR